MKIGVLTSSRADYGIYLPLLNKIKNDSFFELEIIAFGTHTSKYNGYTLREIQNDKYKKIHTISTLISNDDEQSIATSYGLTSLKFADFWANNKYDLVFCLGDRFEMSAAVQAGIPFVVNFAHIHGGETTLGAIDNIYRHQISIVANIHFTTADEYSKKVKKLKGSNDNIITVGSLSLDDIGNFKPIEKDTFYKKFSIPNKDFALVTFHPETVETKKNNEYAAEMKQALAEISKDLNLIITMPNADTLGSVFRQKIEELKLENFDKVILIENFGKSNYFSAMFYAKVMVGNTSSGIIEAASFGKYVVNVGDRQKGRIKSENTIDSKFNAINIINITKSQIKQNNFQGKNIYLKEGAADNIIRYIKGYEKL
jgi:GDP/UDP-N,N'-diacetylbacillosamine 2-epimerase (hydrolysing)